MSEDRYATGMKARREVLGNAHVDRAETGKTAFDTDFQRYITENVWGSVWSRPGLTRRERSLITIGILAALGRHEEVAMHVRAAKNTGATDAEIGEVMLHVAAYAGVPAANQAVAAAKTAMSEAR